MPDSKLLRRRLKTAEGQLLLLALTFLAALVTAVGALCLRSVLFEPYIRHRVAELSPTLREQGRHVATGQAPAESLKELKTAQLAGLYGGLINGIVEDPEDRLADSLFKFHSSDLMDRLTITAAVGSHAQRLKAVELLRISGKDNRSKAAALCLYLSERARRTGDEKIRERAESVLRQFGEHSVDHPAGERDE